MPEVQKNTRHRENGQGNIDLERQAANPTDAEKMIRQANEAAEKVYSDNLKTEIENRILFRDIDALRDMYEYYSFRSEEYNDDRDLNVFINAVIEAKKDPHKKPFITQLLDAIKNKEDLLAQLSN